MSQKAPRGVNNFINTRADVPQKSQKSISQGKAHKTLAKTPRHQHTTVRAIINK